MNGWAHSDHNWREIWFGWAKILGFGGRGQKYRNYNSCQKLFDYPDNGLIWVPGVVKCIDKVEYTVIKATIKWDSTCIGEGESDESVEKLKKYKWNPEKPDDGAWREDLRHLMKKID